MLLCLKTVVRFDTWFPILEPHMSRFNTGSKNCKVNSVNVDGCTATAQSCDLHRGTTVNMMLNFTASEFELWRLAEY